MLTLGQISRQLSVSKFNYLSNAVFGFALAIGNSFRDIGGFPKRCLTIAKNSKIWTFLALGDTVLT